MSGLEIGAGHSPEEVRRRTERVLRRVMAAGQVAQAMWRLVLADLAGLHLRLGYRADGVRLVELATAGEQVSEPVRRVSATVSAQVAAEASDVSSSDRDGSSCDEHDH